MILNEVGLDPGIDHFLALECIRDIQNRGGTIEAFISYCGGLPAPEFVDNPLRYKFSWSPRGALLNTLSAAKYLWDGRCVEIPAGGALMNSTTDLNFIRDVDLEGIPNRDSMHYAELYGLGPDVHTLFRGTIRYKGFAECIVMLQSLGLIDAKPHPLLDPTAATITWVSTVQSDDSIID